MTTQAFEQTNRIIRELKTNGIIIQRYNATTGSVYLKLDYGVLNSIRIADHPGKQKLKYRYNVIKGYKGPIETDMGRRLFYGWDDQSIELLLKQILEDRKYKMNKYGSSNYLAYMKKNQDENKNTKGFWQNAKLV